MNLINNYIKLLRVRGHYVRLSFLLAFLFMFILALVECKTIEGTIKFPYMTKKKASVCLNMIVKNEKEVITRCLESVLPLIDYWVIVDTGSTDGTQEIIQDFMKKHNIPGELHEQEWVNFGHNRQQALLLARFKADYLLFMDADDILVYDENFKLPHLTSDCYLIKSLAGQTQYYITRIVKASLDWHWHGVLHEYVTSDKAKEGVVLHGVKYIYICDGARGKDPKKAEKDVQILLDSLEKEPDNARNMFYLAQSYVAASDFENGLKYYNKRIEMGGWEEEVFWSKLQVAHLQNYLGYDAKEVENSFIAALKYRPKRPEPYFYLINSARIKGQYKKGYELGKTALRLPKNTDTLFVEAKTYDATLLEFAICAWFVGKYDESLAVCNRLLAKKDLAEDLKGHVLNCRQMALEKIKEKKILNQIDDILNEKDELELEAI